MINLFPLFILFFLRVYEKESKIKYIKYTNDTKHRDQPILTGWPLFLPL